MRRLASDARAFQAGIAEMQGQAPGEVAQATDRVAAVTAEEARRVASSLLDPASFQVIVGGAR